MELRGTVKQYIDALDEMKKVYSFNDDEAYMSILDNYARDSKNSFNELRIETIDKETGIEVFLTKVVKCEKEITAT